MKRFLLLAALAASTLTFVPTAHSEQGSVTRTVFHYDGSGGDAQPCSGELMSPVGDIVIQSHQVVDESGGVHLSGLIRFQNFTLTGYVSGDVYRLVNTSPFEFNFTPAGTTVGVVAGVHQLVGPGPDDFIGVILELTITNTNGELVVFPGPGAIKWECK